MGRYAPVVRGRGVGIGFVETAEHAAVAGAAPSGLRGSAVGLLAGVQSFGNLAASGIAGVLFSHRGVRLPGCVDARQVGGDLMESSPQTNVALTT